MDQDLCLVWLYGVIEGVLRSIGRVRQRGPAPELTDAEVLTIQLWGEIWGLPNDASVWRDATTNLHGWFPNLCNEWNFVRRCGSLAKVMDLILVLQLSFCPLASIGPVSPKSGSAKTRTYRTTTTYRGGKKCETQL